MALIQSLVSASLLLSAVNGLSIPPRPSHELSRRAMTEGCGFECTDDMGYFTCEKEKEANCLKAIREAPCTTEEVTDASKDGYERWHSVWTEEAWENMSTWYANDVYAAGDEGNVLPMARWFSNKVHGPENMDCQSLSDNNNCHNTVMCHEPAFPAGYFILNSFTTINNLMWNFYDSMYFAKSDISSSLSDFGKIFAPMSSDSLSTAVIIDMVLLGYVTAAAPLWNSVTKTLPALKSLPDGTDINGVLKDTVNGWVSSGLALAKDLTKAEANLEAERELETRLGAMVEIWAKSMSKFTKELFSGDATSRYQLGKLIADGKLIATPWGGGKADEDSDLGAESLKQIVKKSVYADLIPRAWRMSNLPLGPFIMKTKDCDGEIGKGWVSQKASEKYAFCIDGEGFVLTSAPDPEKHCSQVGDYNSCLDDFQDLPGLDKLDGKAWGGLTVEDIVRGSVATWKSSGSKNGGKISVEEQDIVKQMNAYKDPAVDNPDKSFFETVRNDGVRAAGVIAIPVCDGWEAQDGWDSAYNTLNFKPSETYPCDG